MPVRPAPQVFPLRVSANTQYSNEINIDGDTQMGTTSDDASSITSDCKKGWHLSYLQRKKSLKISKRKTNLNKCNTLNVLIANRNRCRGSRQQLCAKLT